MDFNRRVADWVYGLVSKMDDGEARMFTVFLAEDLKKSDVKNNARMIERTRVAVEKAMTDELANDFLFRLEHGANPEQLVAEAAAVVIAKREPWEFQTRNHGRWDKMGDGYWRAARKAARTETDAKVQLAELNAKYPWRVGDTIAENGAGAMPVVHDLQQHWNERSSGHSGATDTFNRIGAAGATTAAVGAAVNEPNVYAAGQAASLVGMFGPEAEKVVGPSVRRTAYRYRGTEKKPDTKEIDTEADRVATKELGDSMKPQSSLAQPGKRLNPRERLDEGRRNYAMQRGAAEHLSTKLPSLALANLQVESGRIPPSEGVIINDEGTVTGQAVGFAEDHYLPFNLRNLGDLQGGRYVRTRTTGGPTSEDIHAATLGGARSFTVVSRSGEFTVDFADDFRGARRYSDKALSMVDRYEHLLDAVQSKQVEKLPMGSRERAEIREELEDEIDELKNDPSSGFNPKTYTDEKFKAELARRIRQRQEAPRLTSEEDKKIDQLAWRGLNTENPTDREQREHDTAYKQIKRRVLKDKGNKNFKLDGEGYEAALKALQEQYPYFIADVRVHSAGDAPEDYQDGTDQGYVKPRHIRASAAQAGYFGVGIEDKDKSTKRSAEQLNYQNWPVRGSGGGAAAVPQSTETTEEETNPNVIPSTNAPGQSTPVTTNQIGAGGRQQAQSPQEHADQEAEGRRVSAAEMERDDSIFRAADYWAQSLPERGTPGHSYITAEMKILDQLRDSPDPKAFADQNQSALRAAVEHVRRLPSSQAGLAGQPPIVDNVAAVKHAVATGSQNPTTPQPLTQPDLDHLVARGYVVSTPGLGGAAGSDSQASRYAAMSDGMIKQEIATRHEHLKTETDPTERARMQNQADDFLKLLAYRQYKLSNTAAPSTPLTPTPQPPSGGGSNGNVLRFPRSA